MRSTVRYYVVHNHQSCCCAWRAGPFAERPSQVLFTNWLNTAWAERQKGTGAVVADVDGHAGFGVLPLEMFQPDDEKQMDRLFLSLYKSPEVVLHHLTKFVFPAVMHHQVRVCVRGVCECACACR